MSQHAPSKGAKLSTNGKTTPKPLTTQSNTKQSLSQSQSQPTQKQQKKAKDADEDDLDDIFGATKKSVTKHDASSSTASKPGEKRKDRSSVDEDANGKSKKRKSNDGKPAAAAPSAPQDDGPEGGSEEDDDEDSDDDEEELNASEDEAEMTPANRATLQRIKAKLSSSSSQATHPQAKVTVLKAASSQRARPDDDFGFTRGGRGSGGVSRTGEGFKIYQIDDLKMGGGKDTPLCPIDCDCCF